MACVALLAGGACTRGGEHEPELPPGVIVAIGEIKAPTLRAGESATVTISVIIRDGYHVQSNPASSEFYIPLELEIEPDVDLSFARTEYPAGEPYYLEGSPEPLLTYGGRVTVRLPLSVSSTASPGKHLVQGELRYQACDSRRCLFPATVPVSFAVDIAD